MKKKVLLIGYLNSGIYKFLKKNEHLFWIDGSAQITLEKIKTHTPDFIVLHGCHSILSKEIVDAYKGKIVNCHGGYLPWNRGAHPNVWSFVENTPKGATVHYIDKFIDKGQIIDRRKVDFNDNETLESSYNKIKKILENMFIENWPSIKNKTTTIIDVSSEEGTFHVRKDLNKIKHLLKDGWQTKIINLC